MSSLAVRCSCSSLPSHRFRFPSPTSSSPFFLLPLFASPPRLVSFIPHSRCPTLPLPLLPAKKGLAYPRPRPRRTNPSVVAREGGREVEDEKRGVASAVRVRSGGGAYPPLGRGPGPRRPGLPQLFASFTLSLSPLVLSSSLYYRLRFCASSSPGDERRVGGGLRAVPAL